MTVISDRIGEDQAGELAAFARSLGISHAADRKPSRPRTSGPGRPRAVTCKSCGGKAIDPGDRSGRPHGWYSVSVAVPPALSRSGKPYQWVGMYCSARCLAAAMPAIAEAERLSQQDYTPDRPQRPGTAPELAALMRQPPAGRRED